MKYRQLGKSSGLRVSEIGLGSWLTLGGQLKEETSIKLIKTAINEGINFIDTADAYEKGKAEKMIGKTLSEETYNRKNLVLGSKIFFPMSKDINDRGLSRKHIMESIKESLERLQTEYLDIYFCHRFDYWTPLEETILAMDNLIHDGLIHYWGTSCWKSYQLERVQRMARELGAIPPVVEQPMYNMFYRIPELEVFEVCRDYGIGLVVFSPLAEGFLSGKYLNNKIPTDSRVMSSERRKILRTPEDIRKLKQLKKVSIEHGFSLSQLAIGWILTRTEITSAICGATKVKHIEENVKASDVSINTDLIKEIEDILDNTPQADYKYLPQKIY